jgi:hypothetical protein
MFCISSPTGPCRCGWQQPGKWRGDIMRACLRVSNSMKPCSMCAPSARLRQAYSNTRRRHRKGCAGTCTVPVHRVGCGAVQSALSSPTSLALSIFSFVLRSSWSDKSRFFKVKTAFRVKYLVPGNFGRTPCCVRKLRLRSIACSDVEGIRL